MSQTFSTASSFLPFSSETDQAYSLLLLGQEELIKKNLDKAIEYFTKASLLKPQDVRIQFEQGLSLFHFGTEKEESRALLFANKKFKSVTFLVPEHLEAWQFWGKALLELGKIHQEFHYYLEANKKLIKALELCKEKEGDFLSSLYSDYAIVNTFIAKKSKEPYDFRVSIEAFEKAVAIGLPKNSYFWNQFGIACLELSELIADIKLSIQAIHCFKQALTYDPNNPQSWKNLSLSMQSLYTQTQDEDHFIQATQCFEASAKTAPSDRSIYVEWALFLVKSGKTNRDLKKLCAVIEIGKKIALIESPPPFLLGAWGEALSLKGEITDTIELIHEGQSKIEQALEIAPSHPYLWRAFGESVNSLGKYFDEQDYYYQAIEKFQTGLSIDRTEHELWMATGNTYFLIGQMTEDQGAFRKSLYFIQKAIDLKPHISHYHFAKAHSLSLLGELTREEAFLQASITTFEKALSLQKNAIYLHPERLFEYARALELYADFFDEERHYHKAIEIFLHVLMINPDFPRIHYHLALTYSHLAELSDETQNFYRALHFFKLAAKREEDNEQILVDLAVTFINIAKNASDPSEIDSSYQEAESKLILAARAGSLQAYYQLACLYSLLRNTEKAISFLMKADGFNALPSIDEILEDEWLDHIRSSDSFKQFLIYLEGKATLQEEL